MSFALAITAGLCYFIGASRVGSGTYHSLGSGVWIGMICGLVFGDVARGLLIGACINLVYLGVIAPGGQIPADEILASSIAIPLALQGNLSPEIAVTLAMPFGLLGVFLDQIRRTTNIYWLHKADNYAAQGNERGIFLCGTWFPLAVSFIIRFIPVFVLQYYGANAIYVVLNILPNWLIGGFSIAGGILPAIGFAIILKTIGNKSLMPYFFLGFFAIQYLHINTMAASIFGSCIALISYFSNSQGKDAA
jgi:Phosphotransferase system, mannose/fructose/N-acetylgalactosamine-specific component IIC